MNKIYKLFFLLLVGLTVSCSKNDDDNEPLRDYGEQYTLDMENIEEYLDSHYMTVDGNLGVTFTEIPTGGTQVSIKDQTTYPLLSKLVTKDDVDYTIYYIDLYNGDNEQPSRVDSVYVAYRGTLLDDTTFDTAVTPVWFTLDNVVKGWQEIIPFFKTGTYSTDQGGEPVTFTGYGAGVMFIPSGLGYFGSTVSSIPKYSPLIFSFKLHSQEHRDHDRDGILSMYEVATLGDDPLEYDTDGDEVPNYLDVDDDADSFLTKFEIRRPLVTGQPVGTVRTYYPFNGAASDDPETLFIDETQGVPSCAGDFTTTTRLRNYLDASCHQVLDAAN